MIQTGSNKELRIAIPGIMPGQPGQTGMVSTPTSAGGFNGSSTELVSKLNLRASRFLCCPKLCLRTSQYFLCQDPPRVEINRTLYYSIVLFCCLNTDYDSNLPGIDPG